MAHSPTLQRLAVGGFENRNVLVVLDMKNSYSVMQKFTYDPFVQCPIPSYPNASSEYGQILTVILRAYEGDKNVIHMYNEDHIEVVRSKTETTMVNFGRIFMDGRYVLSSSADGYCKVFNVQDMKAAYALSEAQKEIQSHTAAVNFLGYTDNPNVFMTSGGDLVAGQTGGRMMSWDSATGKNLSSHNLGVRRTQVLDSFAGEPCMFIKQDGLGVRFKADPQRLVILSFPNLQRLVEMPITDSPSEIMFAKFSTNGKLVYLFLGEPSFEVRVWDVSSSKEVHRFPNQGLGKEGVGLVSVQLLCSDVMAVITKSRSSLVTLLNPGTGEQLVQIPCDTLFSSVLDVAAVFASTSASLAKSPLVGSSSSSPLSMLKKLVLVGVKQASTLGHVVVLQRLEGQETVASTAVSSTSPPKSSCADHTGAFVSATSGVWLVQFTQAVHGSQATSARVTPDQRFIVTTGNDSVVRLWKSDDFSLFVSYVSESVVTALGVARHPSIRDVLHILLGSETGKVSVLRLIEDRKYLSTLESLAKDLERVPSLRESLAPKRAAANASIKGAGSDLPPQDGGGADVSIDGNPVFPIEEKIMYSQGWSTESGKISANPTFRMSGWREDVLGTRTAASCTIAPINSGEQPDFANQFYCFTTTVWSPGGL